MAVPTILTITVDDWIDNDLRPVLSDAQATYINSNPRYWQGLASHSSTPSADSPASPDQLGQSPTDQSESWNDLEATYAPSSIPLPARGSVRVDTYKHPSEGDGYIVRVTSVASGSTWRRIIDEGTAGRSQDWTEVN